MHNKETQAVGVVSADRADHAVASEMIANNQIDLSALIDNSYPLDQAALAFEQVTSTPSYRVMLNP